MNSKLLVNEAGEESKNSTVELLLVDVESVEDTDEDKGRA